MNANTDISVTDPFGVTGDSRMSFLCRALTPTDVETRLHGCLETWEGRLQAIRVTRYKPGRRCLIEYELSEEAGHAPANHCTLIGKVRAKGLDQHSFRLLQSLRENGFHDESEDGVSVPEPVGIIPELHMWLQRKVPGTPASALLTSPSGAAIARQIAKAIHKLHRTAAPTQRPHTISDEIRILHDRLRLVAQAKPEWATRLSRILERCQRIAEASPQPKRCGIHRDFYSDQVLIDGRRTYLLDFDLYCEGDPALDIGNFLGHLQESSLRTHGKLDALAAVESAFIDAYCSLSGDAVRRSAAFHAALTLVRHIYISTQFPERQAATPLLVSLCEQRLEQLYAPDT